MYLVNYIYNLYQISSIYIFLSTKTTNKMTILYIIIWTSLDLISKYLFFDLKLANNIFFPIANHGISYSLFSWQSYYIISATIIILLWIIYIYHKNNINKLSYILVMAWGLWNFFDRTSYWFVRDFIYIWNRFPVFNIADILIFFWCIMMFIYLRNSVDERIK